MREVSIEQVARAAGVSSATVSRALRGRGGISPATTERVREVAERLGYAASPLASGLASGRAGSVAVVLPYLDRWYFVSVLSAAGQVLREAGLDVLLFHVGDSGLRHDYFSFGMLRKRVDGVLLLNLTLSEKETDALRGLGVPVCMVGYEVDGFHSVHIDDAAGASTAVQHLLNLGHERIAIISGDPSEPMACTAPQDRRAGYRRTLEAAGIAPDPGLEVYGDFTVEGGERATAELFGRPKPPTAIFSESDEMAFGAMKVLGRIGMSVPADISVVGFDNHQMAGYFDLTTIAQPVFEQGRIIARRLVDSIERPGEVPPEKIRTDTNLVIRGSTAVPSEYRRSFSA
jgi:LacI family transcriptional regulator, repressor for deo operon, udp, cdd, tsx, nupC, and nupG